MLIDSDIILCVLKTGSIVPTPCVFKYIMGNQCLTLYETQTTSSLSIFAHHYVSLECTCQHPANKYIPRNATGNRQVLCVREARLDKFIYASSLHIYKKTRPGPHDLSSNWCDLGLCGPKKMWSLCSSSSFDSLVKALTRNRFDVFG